MGVAIEQIEGVGPVHGEKLRAAGVASPGALLGAGRRSAGRRELAALTGVSEARICRWVNMADLFRISGIAGQFAELLELSGVDTVRELRNRNAENLAAKLAKVNEERRVCRRSPGVSVVQGWIDQARTLPPVVEF